MEIDFACKRFPIDQVLRCSFGLSNTGFAVLKTIMRKGELTVEEAARLIGRDRTTIQRAMGPLVAKRLVKRRQYNLDGGGYQFYYAPEHKEEIKQRLREQFDRFAGLVHAEIERW